MRAGLDSDNAVDQGRAATSARPFLFGAIAARCVKRGYKLAPNRRSLQTGQIGARVDCRFESYLLRLPIQIGGGKRSWNLCEPDLSGKLWPRAEVNHGDPEECNHGRAKRRREDRPHS